jgi:hypothetical protein
MAFSISSRRDPDAPSSLLGQIDAELRRRIEEAVDYVCLDVLVASRRARGLSAPVADSASDRDEFEGMVRTFLQSLRADLPGTAAAGDTLADLVSAQVALAKRRPDYWQRFDAVRAAYAAERQASGGERGGLLRRLFGGG